MSASCSPTPSSKPYPDFFQDAPRLGNQYSEDSVLRATLQRTLGKEGEAKIRQEFARFGR